MNPFMIVGIVILVLILLYLLAIKPRGLHKPDWTPFKGYDFAHRGLHNNESEAPENSMAAFRKAVANKFGIELDVQLSKDKVPVVFHDFTLKRMCGVEGKLCDYTLEELKEFRLLDTKEQIPTFQEFLEMVDGKVPLIIELKIEWMDITLCPIVNDMLKKYKGAYCIESFNPLGLSWYRRFNNDVIRGQLSEAFVKRGEYKGFLYFLLQNLLLNWLTKPDFIAYNHEDYKNLSRQICKIVYHTKSVAWTIRSQKELDEMKAHYDMFIFEGFLPRKQAKIKK